MQKAAARRQWELKTKQRRWLYIKYCQILKIYCPVFYIDKQNPMPLTLLGSYGLGLFSLGGCTAEEEVKQDIRLKEHL